MNVSIIWWILAFLFAIFTGILKAIEAIKYFLENY